MARSGRGHRPRRRLAGSREAVDLRDGGHALRRPGRAAARSPASNGEIAPALCRGGRDGEQADIDAQADRAGRHAEQGAPGRQRA